MSAKAGSLQVLALLCSSATQASGHGPFAWLHAPAGLPAADRIAATFFDVEGTARGAVLASSARQTSGVVLRPIHYVRLYAKCVVVKRKLTHCAAMSYLLASPHFEQGSICKPL